MKRILLTAIVAIITLGAYSQDGTHLPLSAGSGSPLNGYLYLNNSGLLLRNNGSAGTSSAYSYYANSGGEFQWGIETSTGSNIFPGSSAYAGVLGHTGDRPLHFFTNNTLRYTIDASGRNNWTGSGSFTGNGNGLSLSSLSGTTNTQYKVSNTSGDAYFGVAGSDGGSVFTGTSANAGYVGTNFAKSFHIAAGGSVGYTMDASRNNSWIGSGTFGGALTGTSATFSGNTNIGTTQTNANLYVHGIIKSKEVKVEATVMVPDYVFEKSYDLKSLTDVKTYITENKHLPEIPSASEIEKDGINVGNMQMSLLKKIEELTLYMIEKDKQVKALEARLNLLENKK